MSSRPNPHRSLNKTKFYSHDSMGQRGARAERRFVQNRREECPECGRLLKAKNLEQHLEEFHAIEEGEV